MVERISRIVPLLVGCGFTALAFGQSAAPDSSAGPPAPDTGLSEVIVTATKQAAVRKQGRRSSTKIFITAWSLGKDLGETGKVQLVRTQAEFQ